MTLPWRTIIRRPLYSFNTYITPRWVLVVIHRLT